MDRGAVTCANCGHRHPMAAEGLPSYRCGHVKIDGQRVFVCSCEVWRKPEIPRAAGTAVDGLEDDFCL